MQRWGVLATTTVLFALAACAAESPSRSQAPSSCAQQPWTCASAGTGAFAAPAPVCLPHEQACAGACFDLRTSTQHCGFCGTACAPGDVCEAGACRDVCGGQLGFCGGQCVDLLASASHCGSCGQACLPGQFCTAGACSATCLGTPCPGPTGSVCVTLSSDPLHCGACNVACAQGQVCEGSRCVLDCGALTDCGGACVDLLSSPLHCGMCGVPCAGDRACTGGMCLCAQGLADCSGACVDTLEDPEHCGGCGTACAEGDLCEGGKCVGPDGCTSTPVAGLSLSEVAVYQAVKIAIMQGQSAVAAGERNADVVQGRDALFRVHVTPAAGFMPREVSARLELTHGAEQARELYFAKLTPSGASSDMDAESTFQIEVPGAALTADTAYAVTLVECAAGAPAGAADGARFPGDGFAELEARQTGPLRVRLVALDEGGALPDLSDASVEIYRSRLYAIFPVTEVEMTVGEPLVSSAGSMCDHLGAVRARRSADDAPVDLYYFGVTTGTSGGQSGCSTASPNAGTSGKTSAGWASSGGRVESGAATMAHELGHAHGRLHSPCQVQDPDPSYPYPDADIGVWAYDLRSDELLPPTRKDMMSYCPNPDRTQAWLSDYTYQALVERVADVNVLAAGSFVAHAQQPRVPWRLLVVDGTGARWVPYPLFVRGTPEGTPLAAVVHGARGPLQSIQVYEEPLEDGSGHAAYLITVPEPESSDWLAIEVPGLLTPLAL